ncbi:hypothetical protein NDU88_007618 [Pleurodeles waltl]|uniref:Uncharacterized protein n=1 Tax=Pleurodeles waltl TaxID=8319 RepID=A0AAV7RS96_PLEWA|nr:hypothetical protein NDU88_007618 [Pleurodeles waltl]
MIESAGLACENMKLMERSLGETNAAGLECKDFFPHVVTDLLLAQCVINVLSAEPARLLSPPRPKSDPYVARRDAQKATLRKKLRRAGAAQSSAVECASVRKPTDTGARQIGAALGARSDSCQGVQACEAGLQGPAPPSQRQVAFRKESKATGDLRKNADLETDGIYFLYLHL